MAGAHASGSHRSGGHSRWTRRALLAVPVVPLTAVMILGFGAVASAPGSPLELAPTAGESPTPAVEYPVLTAPGYAVPHAGGVPTATEVTAHAADIPDVALAAYQRAATVMAATDESCHLTWEVIAAIGRVESDHGQVAGSTLDAHGVATPAIVGIGLDGHSGTTRIVDTDAGELDGDRRFDRAVGPMQFIPATWSYVGVDGDSDGRRDPQDIDDASLSAAVYLCVGKDDLGTEAGLRHALYRYNHSQSYVDLVLSIADSYAAGDAWVLADGALPLPAGPLPVEPTRGHPVAVRVPQPTAVPVPTPSEATPIEPDGPVDPGPSDPGPSDPGPSQPPLDPPGPLPVPGPTPETTPQEWADTLCTELGYLDDPTDTADDFDSCLALAVAALEPDGDQVWLTVDELTDLLLLADLTPPVPAPTGE